MMLGVLSLGVSDVLSSTPNRALEISPEPWGNGGGASFAGREGFGDGGFDEGAVEGLGSFLVTFSTAAGAERSLSSSVGTGPDDVC